MDYRRGVRRKGGAGAGRARNDRPGHRAGWPGPWVLLGPAQAPGKYQLGLELVYNGTDSLLDAGMKGDTEARVLAEAMALVELN